MKLSEFMWRGVVEKNQNQFQFLTKHIHGYKGVLKPVLKQEIFLFFLEVFFLLLQIDIKIY